MLCSTRLSGEWWWCSKVVTSRQSPGKKPGFGTKAEEVCNCPPRTLAGMMQGVCNHGVGRIGLGTFHFLGLADTEREVMYGFLGGLAECEIGWKNLMVSMYHETIWKKEKNERDLCLHRDYWIQKCGGRVGGWGVHAASYRNPASFSALCSTLLPGLLL